ncbi:MAG: hypothetical protein ACTS8P_06510, partial [Arsenophonus sp. NC-XBC3-MAG3]
MTTSLKIFREIETAKNEIMEQVKEVENDGMKYSENVHQQMSEVIQKQKEELTNKLLAGETEIIQIGEEGLENKDEIGKIERLEMESIRKELEELRNRATQIINCHLKDNSESLNFKEYRRNPMEFLTRLEEILHRNKVKQWSIIRDMIDECFQQVNDNWWTAVRHNISSFKEFQLQFRNKYWSEALQHIVRDDICYGKFNDKLGMKPTTYF